MPETINENQKNLNAPRTVSFAEAFRFWAKLGFISFGGPAGQIAIMHKELVEKRRWISNERFLHALNYCMLLPGPEATQLAVYIGWLLHRTWGGIVAGVLFILPSIVILLALSYIYAAYGQLPFVAAVVSGFKPIVVTIIAEAVIKIGAKAFKRWAQVVTAALAFALIYFFGVPFPLIVLAAALVGLAGVKFLPAIFGDKPGAGEGADRIEIDEKDAGSVPPLVIDDNTAPPEHTLPDRRRIIKILFVGAVLWLIPLIAVGLWRGPHGLHVQEYLFFTQAALVTFGGAYAVLAYAAQAAPAYGWMTSSQVVDGLALAETTPGPLIMVLQFIGFMAAWNNPEGIDRTTAAVLGGLITTYVTFLPCFIFIFVGAPYIEVLRGNQNLTGALSNVTAAIVGVILNLALVFGAAVVFPNAGAGADWFSAALAAAAFAALYKFNVNLLWLILGGGLIGLIRALIA